jgi:DNA replication protein DnaC
MTEVPCAARLGLLGERESPAREERRLQTRWPQAPLRPTACREALDARPPGGLAQALRRRWAPWQWRRDRHPVLITGPPGLGQPWLAGAMGHQACRAGWTVLALRLPRLRPAFPLAQGDGRDEKRMTALAQTDRLMLDDWGRAPRSADPRRDRLALRAARHDCRAPLVTSPLPVEHWHAAIGEPPWAAAILDRLVHNADKMACQGESRRTRQAPVPRTVPGV